MSLYDTLGIKKTATSAEIKSAYRSLAQKLHPDKEDTGDKEAFQKLQQAYETLANPEKRKRYDLDGTCLATAPGLRQQALTEIANLLLQTTNSIDTDSMDLVAVMNHSLNHKIREIKNIIKQIEVHIKKNGRAVKRIKCANENNLLKTMLEADSADCSLKLLQLNKALDLYGEMTSIMEDYEYELDPANAVPYSVTWAPAGSA